MLSHTCALVYLLVVLLCVDYTAKRHWYSAKIPVLIAKFQASSLIPV